MTDTPQILLAHHLKALKLPTFLREYDKVARLCAAEGVDHSRYLMRLAEMEIIDRERRMVERRIRAAKFPAVKSLDSFDFLALPSLNKMLVLELARSDYVERRENIIAVGNSGTGKSHIALGLGLAACQKGLSVGFITASALVHELLEARDEKRLLRLQRQLAAYKLLIIDELGYVPLSTTGAELLFEVFSQRYERGSTLVTSNLPFDEWTSVFGSERLTGALLDRLTHHVHIRECYGMTECSSITTANLDGTLGSVGKPVPWFEVAIHRADGSQANDEEQGEIVVTTTGSGALTCGYLDNPEATGNALRNGAFHTGDLGSLDAAGNMYFHGRMSDSARVRGENVSAFEVESVASKHPSVEDCAMIPVAAEIGEQDIKLFVKPKAGATIDPAELSVWLKPQLAPYQRPRYIAVIAEFERTASQRIMKHQLSKRTDDAWDGAEAK